MGSTKKRERHEELTMGQLKWLAMGMEKDGAPLGDDRDRNDVDQLAQMDPPLMQRTSATVARTTAEGSKIYRAWHNAQRGSGDDDEG